MIPETSWEGFGRFLIVGFPIFASRPIMVLRTFLVDLTKAITNVGLTCALMSPDIRNLS